MTNSVAERLRALGQHPGMTVKGQRDCEDGVREIERLRAELEHKDKYYAQFHLEPKLPPSEPKPVQTLECPVWRTVHDLPLCPDEKSKDTLDAVRYRFLCEHQLLDKDGKAMKADIDAHVDARMREAALKILDELCGVAEKLKGEK